MNAFAERTARALFGAMFLLMLLLVVATPRTAHAQSTLANTSFSSAPVSGAVATDAMKQALRTRGLAPPPESGLTLDDYVATRIVSGGNAENRHVSVVIGPEGHLLPTRAWRDMHPNYCKQQARYMRGASQFLDFEIYRSTERHDGVTRNQLTVTARLSDVKTKTTIEQSQGEATNITSEQLDSEGYTADALEAAFAKMGPVAEAPDGPCGEVRLQHIGGRNVGDEFVFRAGFPGVHNPSLSYTWNFGDGSAPPSGAGKIARHVFGEEGTYEVSVTVEGENVEPGTQTIRVELGADFHFTFSGHVNAEVYGDTYPNFGWTDNAVWVGTLDNGTRWVAISFARSGVRRSHYLIVYLVGELGRGTYRTVRASGSKKWETNPLTARPPAGTKVAHVELWSRNLNPLTGVDEVFMAPIYRRHSPSHSDWYEYPLVSGTIEVNEWEGRGSADPHLEAVLDVTLEGRTRGGAPATLHISGEFRADLRFRDE